MHYMALFFTYSLLSYLYLSKGSIDSFYRSCGSNPLENIISDGGLQQVFHLLRKFFINILIIFMS